jgi:hypothetical protein
MIVRAECLPRWCGQWINRVRFPGDALIDGGRKGLEPVVCEHRGNRRAAPADIGAHQVDIGAYAPGVILGPPQVRRIVMEIVNSSIAASGPRNSHISRFGSVNAAPP